LEKERIITPNTLRIYLPETGRQLPSVISKQKDQSDFSSEREILYKILFDMRSDLSDLKKLTHELIQEEDPALRKEKNQGLIKKIYGQKEDAPKELTMATIELEKPSTDFEISKVDTHDKYDYAETAIEEEPLSLLEKEIEMIKQALLRSNGKRKKAAEELGISERTLYRKIKQYDLNEKEEDLL